MGGGGGLLAGLTTKKPFNDTCKMKFKFIGLAVAFK